MSANINESAVCWPYINGRIAEDIDKLIVISFDIYEAFEQLLFSIAVQPPCFEAKEIGIPT